MHLGRISVRPWNNAAIIRKQRWYQFTSQTRDCANFAEFEKPCSGGNSASTSMSWTKKFRWQCLNHHISEWAKMHALGKSTCSSISSTTPLELKTQYCRFIDIANARILIKIASFTSSEFGFCWSGRMLRRLCSDKKIHVHKLNWTYIRTTIVKRIESG